MANPAIVLYQPPMKPWGLVNISPFCAKLQTYLRMAKLPFEVAEASITKAPKGKIPYVTIDGEMMGDSGFIIARLEATIDEPLDAGLDDKGRAIGHAVARMLDEGFSFANLYFRFGAEEGYGVLLPEFKKALPGPLKLLTGVIRRNALKSIRTQGTGRHSHDEISTVAKADLRSVSALLGDKPYLLGDKPRTFDASVFAFINTTLGFPYDSEARKYVAGEKNLVAYHDRVQKAFYS